MKTVFAKKYFIVLQSTENGHFIVYNMRKPWEEGHTHINSYKQASYLVDCELSKKIPQKVNKYFLVSLTRITKDTKYKEQIQRKIDNMKAKQKYTNKPKGFKW